MKVEIRKLDGDALDWAVAICDGWKPVEHSHLCKIMVCRVNKRGVMDYTQPFKYSSEWLYGGPIIEREKIYITDWPAPNWRAGFNWPKKHSDIRRSPSHHTFDGPTPLIAAMRCYVSSVLGDENDEVDVPEELLKEI